MISYRGRVRSAAAARNPLRTMIPLVGERRFVRGVQELFELELQSDGADVHDDQGQTEEISDGLRLGFETLTSALREPDHSFVVGEVVAPKFGVTVETEFDDDRASKLCTRKSVSRYVPGSSP